VKSVKAKREGGKGKDDEKKPGLGLGALMAGVYGPIQIHREVELKCHSFNLPGTGKKGKGRKRKNLI